MTSLKMVGIRTLRLFILSLLLLLEINCVLIFAPPPPRPLCISQFALANHACSFLPVMPIPPADQTKVYTQDEHDDDDHDHDHEDGGGHRHRHHHHHEHRHEHGDSWPQADDCCRWLKELDTMCVCQLLVHLPTFLSRPVHQYTVMLDGTCNVNFTCGGALT